MDALRVRVEQRLSTFFADKREETLALSSESIELIDAIEDLTMRGGKRLRAIVVAAGLQAVTDDPPTDAPDEVVDAGAAIELLQSYLLIHDDWMDLDDERRGGKSVYATLRERYDDDHLGASICVLAGDLTSAYASELFARIPFPEGKRLRALDAFWRMQREVFFGQHLDLLGTGDVERTYDLKTGSYTVRGPLCIGGLLGDASDAALEALDRFAAPLGVAFQLRDELLGTFGDPDQTGKPTGNDLRAGKLTALVVHARAEVPAAERGPLETVLGRPDATDHEIAAATELLVRCGARRHVEQRLATLSAAAERALEGAPLRVEPLARIARLLIDRSY
jgi:geranylgeranyl diphosphate synthase type I